ncbi:MAG: hypothetical protein O3C60_19590 [Planctomycetota bacterium]|nr:hypothetical protein [Planctomycetota bacterium]
MIDNICVPLQLFDLEGFVSAYRAFFNKYAGNDIDANEAVCLMASFEDIPMPNHDGLDPVDLILNNNIMVFFQLHESLADEKSLCIDGKYRNADGFDIGVADGYGFLVALEDHKITLYSALYDGSSGPFPTITLQGTCSVLEDCMVTFAKRFIRK